MSFFKKYFSTTRLEELNRKNQEAHERHMDSLLKSVQEPVLPKWCFAAFWFTIVGTVFMIAGEVAPYIALSLSFTQIVTLSSRNLLISCLCWWLLFGSITFMLCWLQLHVYKKNPTSVADGYAQKKYSPELLQKKVKLLKTYCTVLILGAVILLVLMLIFFLI